MRIAGAVTARPTPIAPMPAPMARHARVDASTRWNTRSAVRGASTRGARATTISSPRVAVAIAAGQARYAQEIQGVPYERIPSSRYRVWCLEELRREWAALDEGARDGLRPLLPEPGAAVLWDTTTPLDSGYDPERQAPFNRALNVFGKDARRRPALDART